MTKGRNYAFYKLLDRKLHLNLLQKGNERHSSWYLSPDPLDAIERNIAKPMIKNMPPASKDKATANNEINKIKHQYRKDLMNEIDFQLKNNDLGLKDLIFFEKRAKSK